MATLNLIGSTLSFPIRTDSTGSLVCVGTRNELIAEAIRDVIETRQGERVMLPDYGLPDLVFAVQDATFATRITFLLKEQILRYVPLVRDCKIKVNTLDSGRAEIMVTYWEVGNVTAPYNLVFPVWRYQEAA